ncbi:MBL fold metallo-hydrolase [Clostridium botulinum]|uniref:ComEC/Rec2 family competence protein n=1 Tax=Clostridium botulinum TaxID=1491 RepID=UPI000174E53C|nr:ComEC/Rec2 family competence protein [Clostridium botulinum]ACD54138.1 metallo beta-lactamase family protein [Clostridium botulinum E3 str. Alaska E43]MBY6816540.1 MBL fold metallo-hydrolase [Clostridium botulinum]MBY6827205.1 MBL fold metallo-hydrolase [Clostridium botulinum]MBY6859153.1 MBL fold metallo-hydrolase [Clostridium botulinum]MBY7041563.1 MBL fold metallo-hydrolase [Clostridium botulinum]
MKTTKKLLSLSLAVLLSTFSLGCKQANAIDTTNKETTNAQVTSLNNMKVHYIDVGQGDSELIQVDGKNILIDAGNNDSMAYNYLKKLGIKKLDYVMATHPHSDHIGGMTQIINEFDIGEFYAPKINHTTKTFENMVKALQSKGIKLTAPTVGDTLNVGNATLQFLAPNSAKYEDMNNYSIACKLKYGNTSYVFMGDAESLSEGEILAKQLDISANVLKLGHHGSHSSTSQAFLDKVNPRYAIVSCGKNNDYGHPHQETLNKLNDKNIEILRTDVSGTIVSTSDGNNINFNVNISRSNTGNTTNDNNSNTQSQNKNNTVWVANKTSKVYHSSKDCSNMKSPSEISLEDVQAKGLKPCSKCN